MDSIPQIAEAMRTVLGQRADELGLELRFVQRQKKLSGSTFVQTLVFGFQTKPDARYEDLCQSAADAGVTITPQGLEQRFTEEAARLVYEVLRSAVAWCIAAGARNTTNCDPHGVNSSGTVVHPSFMV